MEATDVLILFINRVDSLQLAVRTFGPLAKAPHQILFALNLFSESCNFCFKRVQFLLYFGVGHWSVPWVILEIPARTESGVTPLFCKLKISSRVSAALDNGIVNGRAASTN